MAQKIKVANPVVELDGDEMTRIIWKFIKDKLILPYLDLDIKYYDLGMEYRDKTDDKVTVDAANALARLVRPVRAQALRTDQRRREEVLGTRVADGSNEFSARRRLPIWSSQVFGLIVGVGGRIEMNRH